jgi:hypothetical protein
VPGDRDDHAPRSVIVASYVLGGLAVLAAVDVVATMLAIGHLDTAGRALVRAMADAHLDGASETMAELRAALRYNVAVAAVTVAIFGLLAFVIRRRSRAARAAVWIAGVVAAYAFGCGIAANPEFFSAPGSGRNPVEVATSNLLPPWYSVTRSVLTTGELLAIVVCAVSLMRSTASEFYRRQYAAPGLGALLIERRRRPQPPA